MMRTDNGWRDHVAIGRYEGIAGMREQDGQLSIAIRARKSEVAAAVEMMIGDRSAKVLSIADSQFTKGMVVIAAEWGVLPTPA